MPEKPMTHGRIYLAIGSNIEPRLEHLKRGVEALRKIATIVGVSRVYESAPVGFIDQPDFLNAAIEISTELEPLELLSRLKAIESGLGRQTRERWHEREIDFDIIAYGSEILETPNLTIPHPEFRRRLFVLMPLADLDSNFVDPVSKRRIDSLLSDLDENSIRVLPELLT